MFRKATPGFFVVAALLLRMSNPSPTMAQGNASPEHFEVSSIKERATGGSGFLPITITPGGVTMPGRTVMQLIQWAYDLPERDIVGLPAWGRQRRFDVEGRAGVSRATVKQLKSMIRSLLAERFALSSEYERRIGPVYALAVTRSDGSVGPALHTSTAPCRTVPPEGITQAVGQAKPEGDYCGMKVASSNGVVIMLGGVRVTAGDIARSLSRYLDRPVVDRTGLTSAYDFIVLVPRPPAPDTATPLTGGEIFTTIQEELGLKLQPGSGEFEVLVIRSVAPPTEN